MPVHRFAAALAISIAVLAASPYAYASPLHFQDCQAQTGRNASVLIKTRPPFYLVTASGQTEALEPGDEVAAFTPEGFCAGMLAWDGKAAILSLWEDDPLTPVKDGFAPGDLLALHVWDASSTSEFVSLYIRYRDPFDTTGHYDTDTVYAPFFALFTPRQYVAAGPAAERSTAEAPKSPEVALPEEFTLAANYPNPFRSSTTIRYRLPEEATVRLDIYDALGRRVTTLANEVQQPAWYEVELQARHLAPGLYIVRLQADDFVASRRMTLVR